MIGSGGGAGSGGASGAGGTPGTGGRAGLGGSVGSGGSGGAGADSSEYRACQMIGGTLQMILYRLDRATSTCAQIALVQGFSTCELGVTNKGWCLGSINLSADVAACQARQSPTGPIIFATAATGTIAVTQGAMFSADVDVTAQFPASAGLPGSIHARVSGCSATCSATDCRQ